MTVRSGRVLAHTNSGKLGSTLVAWATTLVAAVLPPGAIGQTDSIAVAFHQGKAPAAHDAVAVLGPDLFGDQVNLYNGSIQFEQTDFELPGNSALPVAIVRQFAPRSFWVRGAMADWDLNTPRIQGTFSEEQGFIPAFQSAATRCSQFAAPPSVTAGGGGWTEYMRWRGAKGAVSSSGRLTLNLKPAAISPMVGVARDFDSWEYWGGTNLIVPGHGSQEILVRSVGNTQRPADNASYPLVTSKNWQIGCLSALSNASGEGFTALSPDGVRYVFNWMATRYQTSIRKGDANLARRDYMLMATSVTDRFGNWVRYTYDPANPLNLTRIEANDGRLVTLSYSAGRVSSIYDGTRTWQYQYDANGDLKHVVRADGSRWTFNLRPMVYLDNISSEWGDCDTLAFTPGGEYVGDMTHPSGAKGIFTTRFVLNGRTNVQRACTYVPGSGWTDGSMWPKTMSNQALIRKEIQGPGMAAMIWQYQNPNNPGAWAPCTTCPDRKVVTVIEPSGAVSRHTFGIRWRENEGQLLQVEEGWNGTSALKTTTYRYRSASGQSYPDRYGESLYFQSDLVSHRNFPQDQRVTTQQGATFTWAADTTSAGFDLRARPIRVTESSSISGSRTLVTAYEDNLAKWVLGQIKSVTNLASSVAQERHEYDTATAMRLRSWAFERPTQTSTYRPDGTLQTSADGDGRTTAFNNFTRGRPRQAVFGDGTTAVREVNNLGNVPWLTNEAGTTHTFGFDSMGRVARIDYPTGDSSVYHPTLMSFVQASVPDKGLAAGHWRQTVATGYSQITRWFDGLWRVRLEMKLDTRYPSTTSRWVETRYDAAGRKSFVSFPQRSIAAVDGVLPGKQLAYDHLNRVTEEVISNQAQIFRTRNDYLNGFQKRVTSPRGFATTFSYQAFEAPSEDHITQIAMPEGVTVAIARDSFGKATSITRSGGGHSVSRRYVYDSRHLLCKTIEPETGATIKDYDSAGNVTWHASGLALPSLSACDRASVPYGRMIVTSYDLRSRPATTTYQDGSSTITRTYTVDGQLATISSGGATWTYAYNNRRLLTRESIEFSGTSRAFDWGIDSHGQVASLRYPDNVTVGFNPDALGAARSIDGFASGITHHPNGAVDGFAYGNGIAFSTTQEFRGMPQLWRHVGVVADSYSYDANGNVTQIVDQQENLPTRNMGYDGLDRLTSASGIWGAGSFSYDAIDNIVASSVGVRSLSHNIDRSTNRLASLTGSQSLSFAYDANGNVVQRGAQAFVFDIGNRMTSAPGKASYLYDGHGRRYRLNYADGTAKLQFYSKDGLLLWGEQLPQNVKTRYVHLGRQLVGEEAVATATKTFIHTDALGSPVARTNLARDILSRTRYEPYGTTAGGIAPTAVGFTGHVNDADTGLVYMQQRYYEPLGGRFLSVDPVATDAATGSMFNRYEYARNNPFRYFDPDGRCSASRIGAEPGSICGGSAGGLPISTVAAFSAAQAMQANLSSAARGAAELASAGLRSAQSQSLHTPMAIGLRVLGALLSEGTQSDGSAELPTGLTGQNPRQGSGKRVNTDLPGDSQGVFDGLSGGKSTTQDDGSKVAPNGVRLRPGKDGKGPRIDIPSNGSRPHETIHFPPGA